MLSLVLLLKYFIFEPLEIIGDVTWMSDIMFLPLKTRRSDEQNQPLGISFVEHGPRQIYRELCRAAHPFKIEIFDRAKKQNKKTGKYAFDVFIGPITRHQLSTLPSVFLSHNCILFGEQRTFCWEHRSNGALIPFCSHQKHTVGSYQNINKPHQSPVPLPSSRW